MNSCGVTEEEIREQKQFAEQIANANLRQCKRCLVNTPSVLLQKKDAFCSMCFVEYVSHKFRSTIGKSKQIKADHRVLVCVSTGQSSMAMLNMTMDSLQSSSTQNRLFFQPYILHIDESVLNVNEHVDLEQHVLPLFSSFKIPILISSLESYLFEPEVPKYVEFKSKDQKVICPSDQQLRQKFADILNQFTSLTAKEDFLKQIRRNLMMEVAKKERMQHIFLASNATRLSIQLLTDVAQGKGNQIDSEICFADSRDAQVKVLKPMRELTSKEVALWNKLRKIHFLEMRNLGTNQANKASIGKMTEAFIQNLQRDFPATTYTIGKIGGKLENDHDVDFKCAFCQCQVEEAKEDDICAKKSLILSNSFAADCQNKSNLAFNAELCYGCNILLREHRSVDTLQPMLIRRKQFDQSDFQDCLL